MRFASLRWVFITVVLLGGTATGLDSGPPVGSKKIPAFNFLNCNGDKAGALTSQVVKNGANPVAMIFARELSEPVIALIKKLDTATAANAKAKMGSFVVFCSDEPKLQGRLEELARKEKIAHCIIGIAQKKMGPAGYGLHPEADVTVVLYVNRTVKANFAFKKGEMKEKDIDAILMALPKVLPAKK